MDYKIADKLIELRRNHGYSQDQLADRLFISRQAVSKWERAESLPDTENLIALSKLYGVSIDELLNTGVSARKADIETEDTKKTRRLGMSGTVVSNDEKYEFISDKKTKKGTPFVHIHYSRNNWGWGPHQKAKGIIAIGDSAKGVIAIGRIATGIVSIGAISMGIVSVGSITMGLVSFGTIALSLLVAFSIIAVAPLAFGIVSIGVLAFGIVSVGYAVYGIVAIGQYVNIRNPWGLL